ncbi:MAG: TetM/TetW/TetO/TetS family tetracycline resistance ribosomal protection protein, partial [Clostridia bacterium]|nr:TetM/TetW/TetO/TetS family tetracycline resistance ribosomal protection protein [Clostridia bacterium]
MKKLTLGILANVDAGKTTLSESILYSCGAIRKIGRVDHKDAFFDTDKTERERGITIFSKQAFFNIGDFEATLLDTPGHVDFSTEMERVLSVIDVAILVISASDGVQPHTETLRMLLAQYNVPTLIFINKMDLSPTDRRTTFEKIRHQYSKTCVDFNLSNTSNEFIDELSMINEEFMEYVLEEKPITDEMISKAFMNCEITPCYCGSALKQQGVEELINGIKTYSKEKEYGDEFGARVFKITHDDQGNRLTHIKVTGGELNVKDLISSPDGEWSEKVEQIRIYSGTKFNAIQKATPGTICAVMGLTQTFAGQGLGTEFGIKAPLIEPVLTYKMILNDKTNVHEAFLKLKLLEEEDPSLHIVWNELTKEIHIQLMGAIQLEILTGKIKERLGLDVSFASGSIIYKETILQPVEGVGHFEPLRHYAEVHLLLEPGEPGSGLVFDSQCSEDLLATSWQRLVLTHLEEKTHRGVLTRAPITDMKISLIAGKAHPKHTEGGDFRQATYRAVRHGLMSTKSVLLEPFYRFTITLPQENVGKALMDIEERFGTINPIDNDGTISTITGLGPVSTFAEYSQILAAYTKGRGKIVLKNGGYLPCHNAEEVIANKGYNPEEDVRNTADSVFCAHGSGIVVNWRDVTSMMHLERAWYPDNTETESQDEIVVHKQIKKEYASMIEEDNALKAIFERTYGPIKRRVIYDKKPNTTPGVEKIARQKPAPPRKKEMLLVDGYNIIHAWDELNQYTNTDYELARKLLVDEMVNYQGYKKNDIIVVFDAYRVPG